MHSRQITYADYAARHNHINNQLNTLQDDFFVGGTSADDYAEESSALILEQNKLTVNYTYTSKYEVHSRLDSIRVRITDKSLLDIFNASTTLQYGMLANIILEGRKEFKNIFPSLGNTELRNIAITTTNIDNEVASFVSRYQNKISTATNAVIL